MSEEIQFADWSFHYPTRVDEGCLPGVLRLSTQVEHDWAAFPWYLSGRLVGLLEVPAPLFAYYHLTTFFRARAAMLALTGCVLDRRDLFSALCRHRVQAGGIYREHLLRYLRAFLKKHDLVQLPACEANHFDPLRDASRAEANRALVQQVVMLAEGDYVNALNFVSLATELSEMLGGDSLEFLVKGGEMPAAVGAPLRIRRHADGHDISPSRDEAKAAILAGWRVKPILVRPQGEFAGMKFEDGNLKPESGEKASASADEYIGLPPSRKATADKTAGDRAPRGRRAEGSAQTEKQVGWQVVGDYRVILMKGGRHKAHLGNRPKARAFLRFLCAQLAKSGETEFYVDEMRDAFNAQFSGDHSHRQWVSDRFREDLFRGKEREFDLLFERLDKGTGRYRVREWGEGGRREG